MQRILIDDAQDDAALDGRMATDAMIIVEAAAQAILSDESLTMEQRRDLLRLIPKKIKLANLRSPYFAYGEDADNILTLTVANSGVVKPLKQGCSFKSSKS